MNKIYMLLLATVITSCALRGIRQDDLDAWKGVDLIELETHQLFSTVPLQKNDLSDGTTLYNYSNSNSHTNPVNCFTNAYGYTNCSGGDTSTVTCSNQFFVKNKKVLSYRAIGSCYTDCSVRPASRPCQ